MLSVSFLVFLVFLVGYLCIIFEHQLHINKTTTAIATASLTWLIIFVKSGEGDLPALYSAVSVHLESISQIALFLLGALAIVETINIHQGFAALSQALCFRKKKTLVLFIGVLTFFLSAILDNLTTTIVMVSLLRKMFTNTEERWLIGSGVVIAANAGGAWTPIGDVTTTMLWIGGQLTAGGIVQTLFIPSVLCFLVAFALLLFYVKGEVDLSSKEDSSPEPLAYWVMLVGILCLVFVPIFKLLTGLPPFMGMLFGLAVLWIFTDIAHAGDSEREHLLMIRIIRKVDITSILFFVGILLSVGSLEQVGLLEKMAEMVDHYFTNPVVVAGWIGALSSIVDNVPLVAAGQIMYPLSRFPEDALFWKALAYAAGTGGSILIIGSAAGVVFMGLEKVSFNWYLKKVSLFALAGYISGLLLFFIF